MSRMNLATTQDLRDFEKAERKAAMGKVAEANDDKRSISQRVVNRIAEREVVEGVEETVSLERARGADIISPKPGRGERPKPARRVLKEDGLDHLRPKLSQRQYDAGRRFEAFYRATHRSDTKSCLDVMEGSKGQRYDHSQAIAFARFKLAKAFELVGGHNGMWDALERVCGQGKRPAEVTPIRRAYERLEAQLDCALTILVKHWGL